MKILLSFVQYLIGVKQYVDFNLVRKGVEFFFFKEGNINIKLVLNGNLYKIYCVKYDLLKNLCDQFFYLFFVKVILIMMYFNYILLFLKIYNIDDCKFCIVSLYIILELIFLFKDKDIFSQLF